MREIEDEFKHAGIAVRFVAIASPADARHYCARFGDPDWCLGDPEKRTYEAMGFENFNLLHLLSDPALKRRRAENRAAGFSQDWRATKLRNVAQLPGAAFIDAGGEVRWVHRGTHPGDLPPMSAMLSAAISSRSGA